MERRRERRSRACTVSSQGGSNHSLINLYSWPQTGWQPVKRWSNWNLGNRNL